MVPMRIRLLSVALLLALPAYAMTAEKAAPDEKIYRLKVIELREPDGQILSYRHLAGSTEGKMRGASLASKAAIQLKVGSRPGFVEIDINRGAVSGLPRARELGKEFLAY